MLGRVDVRTDHDPPAAFAQAVHVELVQRVHVDLHGTRFEQRELDTARPHERLRAHHLIGIEQFDIGHEHAHRPMELRNDLAAAGAADVQHRQRTQHLSMFEEGATGGGQRADRRAAVALQEHRG